MKQFKYLFSILTLFNLSANAQTVPANNSCSQVGTCYTIQLVKPVTNPNGTVTLVFDVTNKCPKDLSYIAFELPTSAPKALSYTSTYPFVSSVENPTNQPFYSIKFQLTSGFNIGSTGIFTYTISAADYANLSTIRVQTKAGTEVEYFTFNKKCGAPLPVTLTSFTATNSKNGVSVNWSTASEKDSKYFDIERSTGGTNFTAIGRVNANGTSTSPLNYNFVDKQASTGINYYRLNQVDFSGASEFSSVRAVTVANTASFEVSAAPNPTNGSDFTVIRSTSLSDASIEMFDSRSQMVYQDQMKSGESSKMISTQQMAPGVYFLRLVGADGSGTIKVMVGAN